MRISGAPLYGLLVLATGLASPSAQANEVVTCESRNGHYEYCRVRTHNNVTLDRQMSSKACVQGQSWGFDGRGIWVDYGCRAQFRVRGSDRHSGKDDQKAAAIVAGALIGAAILAAASNDHKHDDHRDHNAYRPDDEFRKNWGNSFSPHENITCYPAQHACYKDGKGYNANWTQRIYGR